MKNPTIATLLNILPGLGYVYVGGHRKNFGALLLIGSISAVIGSFDPLLSAQTESASTVIFWDVITFIAGIAFLAAFMYDAYAYTHEQNAARHRKK